MPWKWIVFVGLVAFGAYQHFHVKSVHDNKPTAQTQQEKQASTVNNTFQLNGYTLSPIAPFAIEARVLSSKHYSSDREADISPVDLALGWGRMADENIIKDVSIVQKGRFYFWRVLQFPIPRREIETSSANMHMVPANADIEAALKAVETGQTVSIKGSLINVKADDGWQWKSSTTRNDTGKGACELVYVEQLLVN